ncbi:MAG TPA: DUF4157 domain-containing protein [Kofleriaceae bacterium]
MSVEQKVQDAGSTSVTAQADGVTVHERTLREPFARHREEASASAPSDVHAAAAHGTSGTPTALPHLEQIQRLFGRHDVRRVRAYVGGPAAEAARAMGAQAFAIGDRVAFAELPDLHTAAHEAAHVVQQRAGVVLKGGVGESGDVYERHADAVADLVVRGESAEPLLDTMASGVGGGPAGVQRKIVIGGKDYDPGPDLPGVQRRYGKDMVEALTTMYNGGKAPPEFDYATQGELMTELTLRNNAIEGVHEANSNDNNLRYARPTDDPEGHLDPRFWDQQGFYLFTLLPGANPADAVRSIFHGRDNVLECNSAMVAIQYLSMLEAMGEQRFNEKFANGGLVISPHHVPMPDGSPHPLHAQGMIKEVIITRARDLIPGDWVYFRNFLDYGEKHPGGFWTGEHALYLGDGKFQGFGTEALTEAEMDQLLVDNYNRGLPPAQHKDLADVPGLLRYVYRPVASKMVN